MEKMISVINDNLRSVINGIKTHKEDTEKTLVIIKNEMDDKIAIASEYKMNVEHARTIIINLENEISELENDLNELNAKFGAKNFKEILAAGNKEINTKIIEKRALISEQSQNILELTDKAHILKDELIALKERKNKTEANLNKSVILESYYEKRINSIIDYSEEHPGALEHFVEETPQEELLVNGNDLENIDISNVVDGSVFEEIDEISTSNEVDEDLIKEVLVNEDFIEEEIELQSIDSIEESENEPIDLTMTQQLDDIILAANNLLEKSEQIKEKMDSHIVPVDDVFVTGTESINNEPFEEIVKIDSKEENKEDVNDNGNLHIFVNDDLENIALSEDLVVMPSSTEVVNYNDFIDNKDNLGMNNILEDIKSVEIESNEDDEDDDVIDLIIENDGEVEANLDVTNLTINESEENLNKEENIISENVFNISNTDFYEDLQECSLDEASFNKDDLEKLKSTFNKNNTLDFIEVMKKHKIPVTNIYESVNVLINVTPQNLDQMLSLLESSKASDKDISYIFNVLDKVNINKLEESVGVNKEAELTEVLYEAIPYIGESDLITRLDLNSEEEIELRKNATVDEFKMMNMFPDVVLANYKALKDLKINNLKECITKHPHRFIYNPGHFANILDKYDTEDLIRCINKNSAVLDRL